MPHRKKMECLSDLWIDSVKLAGFVIKTHK